jgi:hypothetical protein
VRGATLDAGALGALARRDATLALSGLIQAPPSYARATDIKRAEEVPERLRHTGFLDPVASSQAIAAWGMHLATSLGHSRSARFNAEGLADDH